MKKPFLNLTIDHMTFLVEPRMYKVTYALFRIVFGCAPEDIIYEKRKRWGSGEKEKSMTFAARIGKAEARKDLDSSIIAVVQPTEPAGQSSHVREILKNRGGSAHWQHIALRTPDLLAFHKHALERGVNFITPILKDAKEDLIQVFSGEWNLPGAVPTGIFFEFVQRDPSPALLKKLEGSREAFFRDKTFLDLYGEKEVEYQKGKVRPFIDPALFDAIDRRLAAKSLWEIAAKDLDAVEATMKEYAASRQDAATSR
jgi:hypothetical protein